MTKYLSLAAALSLLPIAAEAATFYYEGTIDGGAPVSLNGGEAAFFGSLGSVDIETEGFTTSDPSGTRVNLATFDSGITVTPDAPSSDNNTFDDYIRLSTDNTNASTIENPFTSTVTITLPRPTTFLALEIGMTDSRGIGNNSGTRIDIAGTSFDFTTIPGVNIGTGDFQGFFGVNSDVAFTSFTFAGLNLSNSRDDDFSVDNMAFAAAPIPLPAGAWLLIGGLGALGALRARRKS
jgi:hypothetical protein